MTQNLFKFGNKLRQAFHKLQDIHSEGRERERIFLKVKEKLDVEMAEVTRRKEEMKIMESNIQKQKQLEN